MSARDLSWLARPIAHRGLHDATKGVIENSISAARAAMARGYGIECDVQRSKDGHIVVFHDDGLERLTARAGDVREHTAAELSRIPLKGSEDTIPLFTEFLCALAGRVPLVVEIKSDFDDDMTAARGVAEALANYKGPVVIESFDPAPIAYLRENAVSFGLGHAPLGIVGEARYEDTEWRALSDAKRAEMTHFLHYKRTQPDFLSWNVADFPHAIPTLLRDGLNIPVTTWTVRSREQAAQARQWADQIVFEGFSP